MSHRATPVLVIGAQTAGLGVVRALGRRGVPVFALHYKPTDVAHYSRYATEAVAVSAPDHDEARFVEDLVALGDRLGGGLLVPTADEAVVAVSRHQDALATRFTLACTPWDVTETFIEKRRTYALADAIGVACPRTIVPTCREDALAYAAAAAFPCLVKPSRGDQFVARFGVKMFLIADRHELVARYDLATAAGCEVVLQEFVGGPDDAGVNYNSYWCGGEPLVEFTATKLRGGPPFVGSPRVLVSRRVPEVIEPGRAILKAMGFSGYACTEFKRDARDGRYKLMEVNGRHNLSTALAVRCGIDFPWLQYRHLVHGEVPAPAEFAEGVYWIDLLRDVGYSLTRHRAEPYSLGQYLRPYAARHVYAIPSWLDPAPFVRELWARVTLMRTAEAIEPSPGDGARYARNRYVSFAKN